MTATRKNSQQGEGEPEGLPEGWTFEKALERVEKIVAEMEEGKLPLEAMIGRFEEGQKLIQFCTRKLNEVERRIEILVKKGDAITAEPFDAEALAEPPEPAQPAPSEEAF